jgi:hypothetical protein
MSCPYIGLVPLSEDDRPFFAGREKETETLISSLYASSLTVLYGESGVGKTSLIRAGLLPGLEQPQHRVAAILFREWQSADFDVNLRIKTLRSLLDTINRLRKSSGKSSAILEWEEFLQKFCQGLNEKDPKMKLKSPDDLYTFPLDLFVKACSAAFYGRLFFVFDQFEEYIYYHPLKEKGDKFDAELATAINDRTVPASFLIALREDGLGKLDRLRGRIPDLLTNVVKLEHLDETGAIEAIQKPLAVYNEEGNVKVKLELELLSLLLAQADADRLELEEPVYGKTNGKLHSDIGVRYKAMALQAVLSRLWSLTVEPVLSASGENQKDIVISRNALTQLVMGKGEGEDEVRFVLRTYFDQQLLSLDKSIREDAAEILPHMVRPGSQKKAQSVKALVSESGIPADRVKRALEKLQEKSISLIREISSGGIELYELQHDVMAFAVQDWCIRQRRIIRDEQLRKGYERRRVRVFWYTFVGTAVAAVLIAMLVSLIRNIQESAATKSAYLNGEFNISLYSSGAVDYDPMRGLLVGIDAVASYLGKHSPIPEKALMSLRLGTVQVGNPPSQAATNRTNIWRQIPAMMSPDQRYLLTFESGHNVHLYKYSDPTWKSQTYQLVGKPPFKIVTSIVSAGVDRIGIRSSDGLVELWDFSGADPALRNGSGNFARDLGFISEIPSEQTKEIGDGAYYDSLVESWMIEALGTLTRQYREEDSALKPNLGVPLISQQFAEVSELARQGKDAQACASLQQLLVNIGFNIEQSKCSEILAKSFIRRANTGEDAEVCLNVAERLVPGWKNSIDAQRELIRGNELRDQKKTDEAKEAYRKANALDPSLRIDPEKEAIKPGQSVPDATPNMPTGGSASIELKLRSHLTTQEEFKARVLAG